MTIDQEDRVKSLEAFANASVSNLPVTAAPSVASLSGDRIVGAQHVAVYRDEARVLQKLSALGAAAGEHWYFRYPVRNRRKGTTEYIEGPSIKLANDLARIYGNNETQIRVIDLGESWMIYARFTDFETGYALERPFQQQKGGSKLGGDDDARRLDIALQIGVSKAIRNVTVNALQTFADHAFEAAQNSLVEKIGKNIIAYRDRVVQGVGNLGVDLVRVELVIGKAAKDWTAPDVAKVIAMMKAIADGMATIDETFPPREEKKERVDPKTGEVLDKFAERSDAKPEAAPTAATESQAAADDGGGAAIHQGSSSLSSSAVETTTDAGDRPVESGREGSGAPTVSESPASTNSRSRPAPPPNGTATGAEASPSASAPPSGAHGQRGERVPNATTVAALEELERGGGEVVSGSTEALHASASPRTDAEYRTYAAAWITKSTNHEEVNARWAREKRLRKDCNILQDSFDELEMLKKAKVSELKGR